MRSTRSPPKRSAQAVGHRAAGDAAAWGCRAGASGRSSCKEPSKQALRRPSGGDAGAREAIVILLEPRGRPDLQGDRLARRGPRVSLGTPARRAGQLHRGRVLRGQRRASQGAARARGAGAPRHHATSTACSSTPGPTAALLVPEKYRDRRVGWTDVWVPQRGGLESVRESAQRPALRGRHEHDGAARGGGASPPSNGRGRWASTCPRLVPGQELRDDVKPLEIVQPEGVSFTLDGERAASGSGGRCGWGSIRARDSLIHTLGYQDGERLASGGAPHVVRRDGRALPRSRPTTTRRARRSTSASGASAS